MGELVDKGTGKWGKGMTPVFTPVPFKLWGGGGSLAFFLGTSATTGRRMVRCYNIKCLGLMMRTTCCGCRRAGSEPSTAGCPPSPPRSTAATITSIPPESAAPRGFRVLAAA